MRISEGFPETCDDPEQFFEAHYQLVDEPGAVIRAGLFCEAVANFEYALLRYCVEATPHLSELGYSIAAEDPRDLAKNRLRHLGALVRQDLVNTPDLHELLMLRNIVTHAASEIVTMELRKGGANRQLVIESWVGKHQDLIAIHGFGIRFQPGFLLYTLGVFDSLVAQITQALVVTIKRKRKV